MDKILSTIKIKGNDDLQSMLSSLFLNPKTNDSDWLLSQFYEQISDVDTNCVGSCSAELNNVFIGDESMLVISSTSEFPHNLVDRMCEIFKEIDENFEVRGTYEHMEYICAGAYYGTSIGSVSTEKQLSSLMSKEDYESIDIIESKVFSIKDSLLEECIEELESQSNMRYDGDYNWDDEYDDWGNNDIYEIKTSDDDLPDWLYDGDDGDNKKRYED